MMSKFYEMNDYFSDVWVVNFAETVAEGTTLKKKNNIKVEKTACMLQLH